MTVVLTVAGGDDARAWVTVTKPRIYLEVDRRRLQLLSQRS